MQGHGGNRGGASPSILVESMILRLSLNQQDNILIFSGLIPYTFESSMFPVVKQKKLFLGRMDTGPDIFPVP